MKHEKAKRRVLLLGGSGLLGFHCIERMKSEFEVFPTYNQTLLDSANAVNFSVDEDDSALLRILNEIRPDVVINTIAMVTVDGCEIQPDMAKNLNALFVGRLVNLMSISGLKDSHLIQISSDSVYGQSFNHPHIPWKEKD